MQPFIHEDFLLNNDLAKKLYHDEAKHHPIIDYHCHLNPEEIAQDKCYSSITELWLKEDHYKWRAMRTHAINEKFITGNASDQEKFFYWARTVPYCLGNPLYHWTHLELKRYFSTDLLLSEQTAMTLWNHCNEIIGQPDFSAQQLLSRSKVQLLCTTDDPTDQLEHHQVIKKSSCSTSVLPTFRPDQALNPYPSSFPQWLKKLETVTNKKINSLSKFCEALSERIDFFHERGCRLSDHGLETVGFHSASEKKISSIFEKILNRKPIDQLEMISYQTYLLTFLSELYAQKNWSMQLHIGALRNVNQSMKQRLGVDTGFDVMGDDPYARNLAQLIDRLSVIPSLKVILYCLNPKDNYMLATLIGAFQNDTLPARIQFGAGWWHNDQKDGILQQICSLANLGLLSHFIGMLTDSRSFLSYTRHEYFRRILCNLLGEWHQKGELPDDIDLLKKMVRNICYNNAKRYFGFKK